MPRLKLQVDTDVFELREVIRESGIEERSEIGQIDVHFPEGCFIQTPAIALLTSWLLLKKNEGHTISLEGSQEPSATWPNEFPQVFGIGGAGSFETSRIRKIHPIDVGRGWGKCFQGRELDCRYGPSTIRYCF